MEADIETIIKPDVSFIIENSVVDKAFPHIKNLYDYITNNPYEKKSEKSFTILKYLTRPMGKQFRVTQIVYMYRQFVAKGLLHRSKIFEDWIKAKGTRSCSGIVNITFVFKPDKGSCEMDCDYCPNDPNVTRSYRLDEPAVARAFQAKWDPVQQFNSRVQTLYNLGHEITKLEYIIEGGTFHSYSEEYVTEFIRDCYYAANVYKLAEPTQRASSGCLNGKSDRPRLTLEREIQINETSECPVIGLTIETRPDMITEKQIRLFRRLGVTRVQIGVQSIYDNILRHLNRKCPTSKTVKGIYLLKQNCFKVDLHWMPDLPGTTPEADMLMARWICGETIKRSDIDEDTQNLIGEQGIRILTGSNDIIQGDQFKIYPTMVLPYTRIKEWYERAKLQGATLSNVRTDNDKKLYVPYGEKDNGALIDKLMIYILTHCPQYVRINRVVRDFTKDDILGGTDRLDLRNEISVKLAKDGLKETDIRSREVRSGRINIPDSRIWIQKYRSSEGTEYFISLENNDRTVLFGFIRLRLNDHYIDVFFDVLKHLQCAYIRELHVYGNVVPVGKSSGGVSQHLGIGKFLIHIAECIVREDNCKYMAIIAGVGTREYYKKLGYQNVDTFMVKDVQLNPTPCPPLWKSKLPNQFKESNTFKLFMYIILTCILLIHSDNMMRLIFR